MTIFDVTDFGAAADGKTDDAAALQRATEACVAAGGGQVRIPPGAEVLAGSFQLGTGVDFHVAEGAVLRSATAIEAFPHRVFTFGPEADKRLWIGAKDAERITLSGTGTIDGQCRAFAEEETEHNFSRTLRWRPAMTCFENVRGLEVRDLTFRDAANWTLHFTGCEDVHVHDIRILNNLKFPNADGIDPDHCRRVRIARCHIVAADDCIVLKNTAPFAQYGPCEDIEISDCRLESVSSAFKIGSESVDDFRRIQMRDCTIERSNRGLALQLRDGGSVEDLTFSNITVSTRRFAPVWWGAGEAIYLTTLPRTADVRPGHIRHVRFHNVHCHGENGVVIYSAEPDRISDLTFDNVSVTVERVTPWPDGLIDLRPCPPGFLPSGAEPVGEDTPWGRPATRPPAVILIEGTPNLNVSGLEAKGPAEWDVLRRDG